jgi:lysophospholipase L1-like esterase
MKSLARCLFPLLLSVAAAAPLRGGRDASEVAERFEFQGRSYEVLASFSPGRAGLRLQGAETADLSAGMAGENIYLASRTGDGNFWVFWLNHRRPADRLACYDHRLGLSRIVVDGGFSFIGPPQVVESGGRLEGLVFLANRSGNDDLYYCDAGSGRISRLTATRESEKEFSVERCASGLEIGTRTLRERFRYRLDPAQGTCDLLESEPLLSAPAGPPSAAVPEYYNTYVGFGDSITWGKVEGVQRLDLCFLTRMAEIMSDPGSRIYYGASSAVNLGVPGDTTLDGAARVQGELAANPGLYFILMLGVNDVIKKTFSIDSSLENLRFIIDAAKSLGMRVIVSTLTPSKANVASSEYYWEHLYALSDGIRELAADEGVDCVETLAAFMETNPPDGWQELLEDVIPDVSSGNHPNAEGHRLLAGLLAGALVSFPPLPPRNVRVLDEGSALRRTASWDPCYESDFDHFHIEFDFLPQGYANRLDSGESHYTFTLFPFLPQVYFRLQAVDRGGHASGYAAAGSPAAPPPPPGADLLRRAPRQGE